METPVGSADLLHYGLLIIAAYVPWSLASQYRDIKDSLSRHGRQLDLLKSTSESHTYSVATTAASVTELKASHDKYVIKVETMAARLTNCRCFHNPHGDGD